MAKKRCVMHQNWGMNRKEPLRESPQQRLFHTGSDLQRMSRKILQKMKMMKKLAEQFAVMEQGAIQLVVGHVHGMVELHNGCRT